jgi:hypothetical protein
VFDVEGMMYLAVAYLGMLVAIALWTWTVVQRSRRLDERLEALERVKTGQLEDLEKTDG